MRSRSATREKNCLAPPLLATFLPLALTVSSLESSSQGVTKAGHGGRGDIVLIALLMVTVNLGWSIPQGLKRLDRAKTGPGGALSL